MKMSIKLGSRLACLVLFTAVFISSCANVPSNIANGVTLCCAEGQYASYSLATKNIPQFLEPHIIGSFNGAMSEKDMQALPEGADLEIELRYEQDNLSRLRESEDFEERTASGDSLRFLARIVIDVRASGEDRVLWSGNLQRIHNVGPGEYMHTGRASTALLDAFTAVLQNFPN